MLRKAEERDALLSIRTKIEAYDDYQEAQKAETVQSVQTNAQQPRIKIGAKQSSRPLHAFAKEIATMLFFDKLEETLRNFLRFRLAVRNEYSFNDFSTLQVCQSLQLYSMSNLIF